MVRRLPVVPERAYIKTFKALELVRCRYTKGEVIKHFARRLAEQDYLQRSLP